MPKFDDRIFNNKRITELRKGEEEGFIQGLANQYGYEYIDLRGVSINPNALDTIKQADAEASNIVGFELQNKKLSVAIRNPNNPATKEVLATLEKDWTVVIHMCSTGSLAHAWERYADKKDTRAVKKGVLDVDPDEIDKLMNTFSTKEDVATFITSIRTANTARRISATLEAIFAGALALGASDIHIEPEENDIRLRYRLDGVLLDIIDLDHDINDRLISRLKLLSGLMLNRHDQAQDGRFTFEIGEKEIEVRSSVIPGAAGESMVMRLLDPGVASFNMDQLGLNEIMYDVMKAELARPNGMIITTGPTGSGKTTALYAFLRGAHKPEVKIITIEDPVEYKVDDIVQTQVGENYTFASGLRAVLRQDPDIIMVGEIRDREVAETAVHAAQTGHLVFSTLHTNSAVGAFPRLIDLGVDYRVIGTSINIILGQRLVRVLCEHCKKEHTADPKEVALITEVLAGHPKPPTLPDPLMIFKPVGCDKCKHTGFKGRQGVYEAIKVDDAVEEAVIRDPREHIITEAARAQGIPTMAEDGIEKVLQGSTSLDELNRVVDLSVIRGAAPKSEEELAAEKADDEFSSHVV